MKTSLVWLTVLAGVAALSVAAFAFSSGIRINHTPSLPIGLWRISPAKAPVVGGQIVSFCPPDIAIFRAALRERIIGPGHCPGGSEPMLKPVIAITGDEVHLTEPEIIVNGVVVPHTARVSLADVPILSEHVVPPGSYRVRQGEFWVTSTSHTRSFDSRYFGPVPLEQVQGTADPIFIWP